MWIAPILTEKAQRIRIDMVPGSSAILYLDFWGGAGERKGVFHRRVGTIGTKTMVLGMHLKDVDSIQRERVAVLVAWEMAGGVPRDEFQKKLKGKRSPEFQAAEPLTAHELVFERCDTPGITLWR